MDGFHFDEKYLPQVPAPLVLASLGYQVLPPPGTAPNPHRRRPIQGRFTGRSRQPVRRATEEGLAAC